MKQVQKERYPLHILTVLQLGTKTKIRNYELAAAAYLKKITMRCTEINGKSSRELIQSVECVQLDLQPEEYMS